MKNKGFQILWVLFLKLFGVGVQKEIVKRVGLRNGVGFGVGVIVGGSSPSDLKHKTRRNTQM